MLKRIWADPVWSKVIATGIVAVGAVIASYFLNLLPTFWGWLWAAVVFLGSTSAVWNWLLFVMAGCTLVVLILIVSEMRGPTEQRSQFDFYKYHADEILGSTSMRFETGSEPGYYVADIEAAVAENAARRKRNKSPNVLYYSDDEYRKSLARGLDYFDWCYKSGSYDSGNAYDLAFATWHSMRGKSPEWVAEKCWGDPDSASHFRRLVRPVAV